MKPSGYKRKTDRTVALKPTDIVIGEMSYRLNDISNEGIGIVVDASGHPFHIGQRIEAIPIALETGDRQLSGVVAHITKTSKHVLCGNRFLLRDGDELSAVVRFRQERRLEEQG